MTKYITKFITLFIALALFISPIYAQSAVGGTKVPVSAYSTDRTESADLFSGSILALGIAYYACLCIVLLVSIVLHIYTTVLISNDATSLGMNNLGWALFYFFVGAPAFIIYILKSREKKRVSHASTVVAA